MNIYVSKFATKDWKDSSKVNLLADLPNKRIDDLTLNDCINIQIALDGLTRDIMIRKSFACACLFEFIHNFLHLRIAVEKYGDLTGYAIANSPTKTEEEKKEVDA